MKDQIYKSIVTTNTLTVGKASHPEGVCFQVDSIQNCNGCTITPADAKSLAIELLEQTAPDMVLVDKEELELLRKNDKNSRDIVSIDGSITLEGGVKISRNQWGYWCSKLIDGEFYYCGNGAWKGVAVYYAKLKEVFEALSNIESKEVMIEKTYLDPFSDSGESVIVDKEELAKLREDAAVYRAFSETRVLIDKEDLEKLREDAACVRTCTRQQVTVEELALLRRIAAGAVSIKDDNGKTIIRENSGLGCVCGRINERGYSEYLNNGKWLAVGEVFPTLVLAFAALDAEAEAAKPVLVKCCSLCGEDITPQHTHNFKEYDFVEVSLVERDVMRRRFEKYIVWRIDEERSISESNVSQAGEK